MYSLLEKLRIRVNLDNMSKKNIILVDSNVESSYTFIIESKQ